jgi:hypothetical protein
MPPCTRKVTQAEGELPPAPELANNLEVTVSNHQNDAQPEPTNCANDLRKERVRPAKSGGPTTIGKKLQSCPTQTGYEALGLAKRLSRREFEKDDVVKGYLSKLDKILPRLALVRPARQYGPILVRCALFVGNLRLRGPSPWHKHRSLHFEMCYVARMVPCQYFPGAGTRMERFLMGLIAFVAEKSAPDQSWGGNCAAAKEVDEDEGMVSASQNNEEARAPIHSIGKQTPGSSPEIPIKIESDTDSQKRQPVKKRKRVDAETEEAPGPTPKRVSRKKQGNVKQKPKPKGAAQIPRPAATPSSGADAADTAPAPAPSTASQLSLPTRRSPSATVAPPSEPRSSEDGDTSPESSDSNSSSEESSTGDSDSEPIFR